MDTKQSMNHSEQMQESADAFHYCNKKSVGIVPMREKFHERSVRDEVQVVQRRLGLHKLKIFVGMKE